MDRAHYVSRPKPGDDEDDLLEFQRTFLSSKSSSSATVVTSSKPDKRDDEASNGNETAAIKTTPAERDVVKLQGLPSTHPTAPTDMPQTPKRSKFQQKKDTGKSSTECIEDPEESLEKHDRHITKVLSEIKERDVHHVPVYFPRQVSDAFPKVLQWDPKSKSSSGSVKKRSIFAQQLSQQGGDPVLEQTEEAEDVSCISEITESECRGITSEERKKIHEENLATMASMTEQEILAEQAKLKGMLDPKLIELLTKRRHAETPSKKKVQFQVESTEQIVEKKNRLQENPDCELNINPEKTWLHMDKVEPEKLAWMKDLPPAKLDDIKTGQTARFDFQGLLISSEEEVPTHIGLHHHGEDPQRPGYTLEELFTLARSANIQQRVMALQTLSKIIQNAKKAVFAETLQRPILPAVLEAGLVFLIRWALDDSVETTVAASVQALAALLVNLDDEAALDTVSCWYRGLEILNLASPLDHKDSEDEGDKTQQTDADIVKQDVIQGLLRMDLLPRLRYVLEVLKPTSSVVVNILDVLCRIASHSLQSAQDTLQCPRLIDTICREFLPLQWKPVPDQGPVSSVYGCPVAKAMKLIRMLCSAGKNMAAILVSKYKIINNVKRYIAVQLSELQLPAGEDEALVAESFRTWRVLLSYGLTTDSVRDLYPVLIGKLQHLSTVSLQSVKPSADCLELMALLETVVHVAASHSYLVSRKTSREAGDGECEVVLPAVDWSTVAGLIQPVELLLTKYLEQFEEDFITQELDVSMLTCALNFTATFYLHLPTQPMYDPVVTLPHVEAIVSTLLTPCLASYSFKMALSRLSKHSVVLGVDQSYSKESPSNLPSLLCTLRSGQVPPVLLHNSPYSFLTAMARLLLSMGKIHKGFNSQLFDSILCNKDTLGYVKSICSVGSRSNTSVLTRYENHLQYFLIKLACLKTGAVKAEQYHQLSLCLLTHLQHGDEHYIHDILSTVLFNPDFLCLNHSETKLKSSVHGRHEQKLSCESGGEMEKDLVKKIQKNLPSIRATYLESFGSDVKNLLKSRSWSLHLAHEVDTQMTGPLTNPVVPVDWMFLPLMVLYQATSTLEAAGESVEKLPAKHVSTVSNCLQWVYLLEHCRHQLTRDISAATRISRVMCTFLIGSDLFLEGPVHCLLAALMKMYCQANIMETVDFDEKIPGLASFYDLFVSLVEQYEAVSFGDPLFASYLLLPMAQRHSVRYRKVVWGEHVTVLRLITVTWSQLPIQLQNFLEPEETNLELLRFYLQSLLSSSVTPSRNPVLYTIALHHVNRFIYLQGQHMKMKKLMIQQICKTTNEDLKKHLLFYKMANKESLEGVELYSVLPQHRKELLTSTVPDIEDFLKNACHEG